MFLFWFCPKPKQNTQSCRSEYRKSSRVNCAFMLFGDYRSSGIGYFECIVIRDSVSCLSMLMFGRAPAWSSVQYWQYYSYRQILNSPLGRRPFELCALPKRMFCDALSACLRSIAVVLLSQNGSYDSRAVVAVAGGAEAIGASLSVDGCIEGFESGSGPLTRSRSFSASSSASYYGVVQSNVLTSHLIRCPRGSCDALRVGLHELGRMFHVAVLALKTGVIECNERVVDVERHCSLMRFSGVVDIFELVENNYWKCQFSSIDVMHVYLQVTKREWRSSVVN